ncbi:MAG TPA: hypothetical protein VFC19_45040 [Candidatus Limnocylindrales bacterium]|nr:hypothetical protein [Candidatus Limnocylindrales bacterium]
MTTMTTATPQTVERLRELAQALDTLAAQGITDFSLYVSARVSGASVYQQADRVSMVDALAAQLGLTAEMVKTPNANLWSHEARTDSDHGVRVVVTTHIDPPAQRCACGAACSHQRA